MKYKDNRGTFYCNYCERRHYNVHGCPNKRGPDDLRKNFPEGYRLRTHSTITREVRPGTDNVFDIPHKAARVGKLSDPELPDAA